MPITCSICTVSVVSDGAHSSATDNDHPCTIPCGHVFHNGCLRHWLKRPYQLAESTCPECRARCNANQIIKLYMIDESPASTPFDISLKTRNLIKDWQTESLQLNRLIVRLTEEISELEYKLKQVETAGQTIVSRLDRELAKSQAEHKASEKLSNSKQQSLQDQLRAMAEKLQHYEDVAAMEAASR